MPSTPGAYEVDGAEPMQMEADRLRADTNKTGKIGLGEPGFFLEELEELALP